MKKIILRQVKEGCHAQLEDRPEIWGAGKTSDEAIGALISAHAARFDIEIQSAEQLSPETPAVADATK